MLFAEGGYTLVDVGVVSAFFAGVAGLLSGAGAWLITYLKMRDESKRKDRTDAITELTEIVNRQQKEIEERKKEEKESESERLRYRQDWHERWNKLQLGIGELYERITEAEKREARCQERLSHLEEIVKSRNL